MAQAWQTLSHLTHACIISHVSALLKGLPSVCNVLTAGYGASGDAHHITSPAPDGAGLADAFERALTSAGCTDKSEVTYINAHGTSTQYNDKFETLAIKVSDRNRSTVETKASTVSQLKHM